MRSDPYNPFRVVIAGGGVAGLEATLALRALAEERVSIEVLAPEADFTYRPLAVAEPFRVADVVRFPLRSLVEHAGAEFRPGSLASVDDESRVLTTSAGDVIEYDALLLALGARPREAVPHALTFGGPDDVSALRAVVEQAERGEVRRLVFAVPGGVAWPLPLYELALLTAAYLTDNGAMEVDLAVVTPEAAPLAIFGAAVSDELRELLELREIRLHLGKTPSRVEQGVLRLVPEDDIEADHVVALPRLEGPSIPGVLHDGAGFVPVGEHGLVTGLENVYAAGDLTQFPIKQGGLAAQQADAAASAIAARAGAPVEPEAFRPVLRGLLLTGIFPRYLRAEVGKEQSTVDTEPLWWPPAKIVGRYLAPFLAARTEVSETAARATAQEPGAIDVGLESESRPAS